MALSDASGLSLIGGVFQLTSSDGSVVFSPLDGIGHVVDLSVVGGGGGVTTLQGENGAITLTSTGSTIAITVPSTGTINLEAIAGGGTVTTTGSPSAGNISIFSGSTSITNGDLSGDISTSGSTLTTLATVNSNVGSFGTAGTVSTFTVNGKGLITAASDTAIQITESQVTNLVSDLAGKLSNALTDTHIFVGNSSNIATDVAMSGDATIANTGAITLATVNGNVGTFTTATITVNAKGLITAASSGTAPVTSVSGTADRITSTGGTTPVIDIAATYVGQSSITTLGTITTGTWNGTDIAFANIAQLTANSLAANATTGTADIASLAISASRLVGRDASSNLAELTVGGGVEFTTGGIQTSAFTGDATKTAGGTALTLATVNSNVGAFGDANNVGTFTVNAKGLITAASNVSIIAPQVVVADAGGDTTTWVMLATSQTGNMAVTTDGGLTYNATTNVLTASSFSGNLLGGVDVKTENADATCFPLFANASSGFQNLRSNPSLTYNSINGDFGSVTFSSTATTGTAPLTVASTTKVTNFNADLLDDKDTGTSGNVIGLLDGNNTHSGNNIFTGNNNVTAGYLLFNDNIKALFGDSSDSEIYYDATNLIIQPTAVGSGSVSIGPTATYTNSTGGSQTGATENLLIERIGLGGSPINNFYWINYDLTTTAGRGALGFFQNYTGTGGLQLGVTSKVTYSGSSASPSNVGVLSWAIMNADNSGTSISGLRSAADINAGFVFTQGTHRLVAFNAERLTGGGSHTSGTILGYGFRATGWATVTTAGATFIEWGGNCQYDFQLHDDAKLIFGGNDTTKGDSYDIYNSATTDIDRYVNGTQTQTWDNDAIDIFVPLNIQSSLQCDSIVNDTGLAAGTYTPTLTNVTNLGASTAYECQYMRVGNTVTVSGKVDVDPTAAGATELGISLPIASNFGAQEDCAGTAFASGIAGQGAGIRADATNDRAAMVWVAVDTTNQPMYFTFTYQVI